MAEWRKKNPEEEGIPSLLLSNMHDRWEERLCHVHGYIILRNENLVAEAYRYPYSRDGRRLLHSVSKTVTALAVGFAVEEGLIRVEDKVLSFFPDYEPKPQSLPFLSELTIYHLLTMAIGHASDSLDCLFAGDKPAWKAFLEFETADKPGNKFVYDSGAAYMLSKIMTVLTGEKLLDYLVPRLFQPLGIADADWDELDGANTGGWGCILSLPDMVKIGQLLLNKGSYGGRRLLPEEWIEEMSGRKIATDGANVYQDWQQGYGYQMWRCDREGCYRADGAFGQYILVMPPKNMVAAIWCEDAYSQDMLNVFWEELYDKVEDKIYGIDGNAYEIYHRKCIEWASPYQTAPSYSYREMFVDNKQYEAFEEDGIHFDSISFSFSGSGRLKFSMRKDGALSEIQADNTGLYFGEERMNFEIASYIRLGKKRMDKAKYAANYQWLSDCALKIHIYWLETAHATDITCVFSENGVTAVFSASYRKFLTGLKSSPGLSVSDRLFIGKI